MYEGKTEGCSKFELVSRFEQRRKHRAPSLDRATVVIISITVAPFLRRVTLTMRLFTSGLSFAVLSFCFLGLAGCGEDNEAASRDQAAKTTTSVDSSKVIPQSNSQADYFKNNPGTSGAATGKSAGYPGAKR
jgi:hypothetical protein